MATPKHGLTDKEAARVFPSDTSIKKLAKQLKIAESTLQSRWVHLFGEEAVQNRKVRLRQLATTEQMKMSEHDINALWFTDLSATQVAEKYPTSAKVIRRVWKAKYGEAAYQARCRKHSSKVKNRAWAGVYRERHPSWKGGRVLRQGYVLIHRPSWWTGKQQSDYVLEHQVIYCEHHGLTEIPEGMHIHHVDGDKQNNAIENLEMLTPTEHAQRHIAEGTHGFQIYRRKKGSTTIPKGSRGKRPEAPGPAGD